MEVGGLEVFDGDLHEAVSWCLARRAEGFGSRVATANLDFFAIARRNPVLHADLAGSSLVVADGAPVAWLARAAGASRARRVAGVDFVAELCRAGAEAGEFRVALYGATAEVCEQAAGYLREATGAVVVERISPPFRPLTPEERREYDGRLAAARPDAVFVALGCPAQERFIAESFGTAPTAVWIGVGGTFDFFAGRKRRAPGFLQALGLEWLVRFAQEPRRLGPRYFGRDIPELVRLTAGLAVGRVRRREPGEPVPVS